MNSLVCYGPKDLRMEKTAVDPLGKGEVLVNIEAGGICGSDLHYYNNGGFGTVRIKEPMILGHEVAGRIAELGANVAGLNVGDLVAVTPSRPCWECEYCRRAEYNQCLNMRYYGSAMPTPHIQGAFRQKLVANAVQCYPFSKNTTASQAAFAEPLAVALHAVKRAGNVMGKRVLVTGSGPIGALVIAVAKMHGALEVVATDVADKALDYALQVGADKTVNVATNAVAMNKYFEKKGYFDIVVEASGNQAALISAFNAIRPRGRLVQLGMGGDVSIPQNQLVGKEIELCGSFRFHEEFGWAVELIDNKRLNIEPLISHKFAMSDYIKAFETASNRAISMKVQLSF